MCKNSADIVFVTPSMAPDMRQESIGTLILAKEVLLNRYEAAIVRFWEASKKNTTSSQKRYVIVYMHIIPK